MCVRLISVNFCYFSCLSVAQFCLAEPGLTSELLMVIVCLRGFLVDLFLLSLMSLLSVYASMVFLCCSVGSLLTLPVYWGSSIVELRVLPVPSRRDIDSVWRMFCSTLEKPLPWSRLERFRSPSGRTYHGMYSTLRPLMLVMSFSQLAQPRPAKGTFENMALSIVGALPLAIRASNS